MSRWLLHPRLTLLCRLALGATFLVAAWPKLLDPPAFAKAMAAYALMPAWAVHPAALVLPWLEALTQNASDLQDGQRMLLHTVTRRQDTLGECAAEVGTGIGHDAVIGSGHG